MMKCGTNNGDSAVTKSGIRTFRVDRELGDLRMNMGLENKGQKANETMNEATFESRTYHSLENPPTPICFP